MHSYSSRLSSSGNRISVCYYDVTSSGWCIKPSKREFEISICCYCKGCCSSSSSRRIIFYCYFCMCHGVEEFNIDVSTTFSIINRRFKDWLWKMFRCFNFLFYLKINRRLQCCYSIMMRIFYFDNDCLRSYGADIEIIQ